MSLAQGYLDGYMHKGAADSMPRQIMGNVAQAIHPIGPKEMRFADAAAPVADSDAAGKIIDATEAVTRAVPGTDQALNSISEEGIHPYSTSTPFGKHLSGMANTLGKLIPKSLLYSGLPRQ